VVERREAAGRHGDRGALGRPRSWPASARSSCAGPRSRTKPIAIRTIDRIGQIAVALAAALGPLPAPVRDAGPPVAAASPKQALYLRFWQEFKPVEVVARFDGDLIFDALPQNKLPQNKGCRIETRLLDVTVEDQDRWPAIRRWMEDSQARLRAAVAAVGGVPSVSVQVAVRRPARRVPDGAMAA